MKVNLRNGGKNEMAQKMKNRIGTRSAGRVSNSPLLRSGVRRLSLDGLSSSTTPQRSSRDSTNKFCRKSRLEKTKSSEIASKIKSTNQAIRSAVLIQKLASASRSNDSEAESSGQLETDCTPIRNTINPSKCSDKVSKLSETPDKNVDTDKNIIMPASQTESIDQCLPGAQELQGMHGSQSLQGSHSSHSTPKIRTRLSTGSIHMNGTQTISAAKEKAELEMLVKQFDGNKVESPTFTKSTVLSSKKRMSSGMVPGEGLLSDHPPPKKRKIGRNDGSGEDNRNDYFCWLCHKEGTLVCCELCPRVYHSKCLGLSGKLPHDWVCPECEKIMRAECVDTRSKAMEMLTIDQLCTLLKYALERMQHAGCEPFQKPVDLNLVPNYSDYIFHPMDLSTLEKNIKKKTYGCTEALLADAKWILHNCIIYNGAISKLTSSAKMIIKICKHEVNEIELCPDCYLNSCIRKNEEWFSETCRVPHTLVWAKLKGYPFWPSKALRETDGQVDVRFFGAHDRSWVPVSQCFLLSKNIPTSLQKGKKNAGLDGAIDELNKHIEKLIEKFGSYEYAPFRTPYDKTDCYKPIGLKPPLSPKKTKSKSISAFTSQKSNTMKRSAVSKTASALKNKYNAIVTLKKIDFSPEKLRRKSEGKDLATETSYHLGELVMEKERDRVSRASENIQGKLDGAVVISGININTNTGGKGIKKSFVETSVIEKIESKIQAQKALDYCDKSDDINLMEENVDEQNVNLSAVNTKNVEPNLNVKKIKNAEDAEIDMDLQTSSLKCILPINNTLESLAHRDIVHTVPSSVSEISNKDGMNEQQIDLKDGLENDVKNPDAISKHPHTSSKEDNVEKTKESKDSYMKKLVSTIKSCKEKLGMENDTVDVIDKSLDSNDYEESQNSENDSDENDESGNDESESEEASNANGVDELDENISNVDNDTAAVDNKVKSSVKVNGVLDKQQKDITTSLEPGNLVAENKKTDYSTLKNVLGENESKTVNKDTLVKITEKDKNSDNVELDSETVLKSKDFERIDKVDICKENANIRKVQNRNTATVSGISPLSSTSENVNSENPDSLQARETESNRSLDDSCSNKSNKSKASTVVDESNNCLNKIIDAVTGQMIDASNTEDGDSDLERLVIDFDVNKTGKSCKKSKSDEGNLISSNLANKNMNNTRVKSTSRALKSVSVKTKKGKQNSDHDVEVTDKGLTGNINRNKKRKACWLPRDVKLTEKADRKRMENVGVNAKNKAVLESDSIILTEIVNVNMKKKLGSKSLTSKQKRRKTDNNELTDDVDGNHRNKISDLNSDLNLSSDKELSLSIGSEELAHTIDDSIEDASYNLCSSEISTEEATQSSSLLGSSTTDLGCKIAEKFSQRLLSTIQNTFEEMCAEMIKEQSKSSKDEELFKQLERARWNYRTELVELKHNFQLTISEMKSCWEAEKEQLTKNIKSKCQTEKEKAVWDAKKKQWCAYCGNEAIFYCCWNTSYCDYPCQQNHWPQHMHTCLQTNKGVNKNTSAISSSTITPGQSSQSQVLAVSQSQAVAVMSTGQSSRPQSTNFQVNSHTDMDPLRQLQDSMSTAIHREEERRSEARPGLSPKYLGAIPTPVSLMQNVRQGVPVSMAPNMMFTMQPGQAGMMQQMQRTRFVTPQVVTSRKLSMQRGNLPQSPMNSRMVFTQPLVQQTLYPLQHVQPQQQLGGTILFQNPQQQNMMAYGMPRPF